MRPDDERPTTAARSSAPVSPPSTPSSPPRCATRAPSSTPISPGSGRASCGWRSACARSARGTSPRSRSAKRSSGRGRGGSTHRDRPIVTGETAPTRWSDRAALARRARRSRCARRARQHAAHDLPEHFDVAESGACVPGPPATCSPASVDRPPSTWCGADRLVRRTGWTSRRTPRWPSGSCGRSAAEESDGMEDARFIRFVDDDGTVEYRATYTAYDGRQIARRLIRPGPASVPHLPLAGPAARNKGMALFPRLVNGRHLALCRTDGENIAWPRPPTVLAGRRPPLLDAGQPVGADPGRQLRLTHRDRRAAGSCSPTGSARCATYAIGAILLDLDDPETGHRRRCATRCWSRTSDERDGYVPNVVYSCGGLRARRPAAGCPTAPATSGSDSPSSTSRCSWNGCSPTQCERTTPRSPPPSAPR